MIVVRRAELVTFPLAILNIVGSKEVGFASHLVEGADKEFAVHVAYAACPRAFAVGVFAVEQHRLVLIAQSLVCIAGYLPVAQVFRLHNWHAGVHMHCGATHIIGVAYAYHRHVGHIGPNHWVGESRFGVRTFLTVASAHYCSSG